jgi:hypothetical protein
MKRCVLFIVALTLISTLAVAQAVVTPYGQATQYGAAVPIAPYSPPLVTTPLMHLGNARTTPGTSTAAITSTTSPPEPPSAVPIRPEIDYGPQIVYVGPPNANVENNNATAPTAGYSVNGRQMVDLGVHSDTAMMADDGTHGRSLGDIARNNRQRMQGANARNFTNADVQRMAGAGGVSGIATSPANNAYPADNGVINSNGVATQSGVASPTNAPAANDQNAQPATPVVTQPAPSEKPSAGTPPPNMAQAQTPANPADQNAAPANTEQRTLPKSASPLPLLGLLGFTAAGAGLVVRKFRR